MSKVAEFDAVGGPEQLKLVEREIPAPGAGEVQVDIKAAGLNRAELMFLAGQYLVEPVFPAKIGMEGAGVVTAVGANVTDYKIGDEVSIAPNINVGAEGAMAERCNFSALSLHPKPSNVSFVEAATFWMAYPTAYGGLVQAGGLRDGAGQSAVITAASSSVGLAAIQVTHAHGAKAIATTRTATKAQELLDAGADHVITTDGLTPQEFGDQVRAVTDGKGFDVAFDPVAGPMVGLLAEAASNDATIVGYGFLSGNMPELPLFALMRKGSYITGFHVAFHLLMQPERMKVASAHLLPRWQDGTYKATINKTFAFADVAKAYEHLSSNTQFGKIVVEMD